MTVQKEEKKREIINNKDTEKKEFLFSINKDKIKKMKKYSLNDIKKINEVKLREYNDSKIEKENIKILERNKFNTNTELLKVNNKKIKDEIITDTNIISINNSLTPRNTKNIELSLFSPLIKKRKPDELLDKMIKLGKSKKVEYKKIKKLEINKDNRHYNKVHIFRFPNYGNDLLTTRLFKKYIPKMDYNKNDDSRCLSYEKTMSKFNSKILPNLFDKIIFKKGETEKFINYQFYNSAYKACCDTSKNNAINNISLKTNYKNNWKSVTNYLKKKREHKKK